MESEGLIMTTEQRPATLNAIWRSAEKLKRKDIRRHEEDRELVALAESMAADPFFEFVWERHRCRQG